MMPALHFQQRLQRAISVIVAKVHFNTLVQNPIESTIMPSVYRMGKPSAREPFILPKWKGRIGFGNECQKSDVPLTHRLVNISKDIVRGARFGL